MSPRPPTTCSHRQGPLSVRERHVVYAHVNSWVQQYGLDAFSGKQWTCDEYAGLTRGMNRVNRAQAQGQVKTAEGKAPLPREVMSVRREVGRLYQGRKSPLGKLVKRAECMRRRVEVGVEVGDGERYPRMAVHVPEVEGGVRGVEGSRTEEGSGETGGDGGGETAEKGERGEEEEQEERLLVTWSVDWNRLHVRKSGEMAVLSDGEVWESSDDEGF